MNRPLITLILPAYNEKKTILNTVKEAVQYFENKNLTFEIIVSADGTDGTREVVNQFAEKDPRVSAIGENARTGKGCGTRRAVKVARGKYVGFADADNKTPISNFDRVFPLLEKGAPIVIGSRGLKDSEIESKPLYRRLGSLGFRYGMQVLTGLYDVPDTQCGFKFFDGETARKLFSIQKTDGYMFDVELLLLARKLGIPFEQVPVRWKHDGDSRLQLFRSNIRNLRDLLKIRASV